MDCYSAFAAWGTLNSRRAATREVGGRGRLLKFGMEDSKETQRWKGTILCKVFKATNSDRRTSSPLKRWISKTSIGHYQTGGISNNNLCINRYHKYHHVYHKTFTDQSN
ncbi:hypothetical protein TNCV_775551 [Trichonephila clavipes]|uniref:Uncharacterized protein n=1 Tax=Trichonephila clavipes TaxID=2585209 RepID=A0A8X6SDB5_TRICX|nr:hypothetical protein TNCV_775551 [Trichonephila clavipes]